MQKLGAAQEHFLRDTRALRQHPAGRHVGGVEGEAERREHRSERFFLGKGRVHSNGEGEAGILETGKQGVADGARDLEIRDPGLDDDLTALDVMATVEDMASRGLNSLAEAGD